MFRIYRLNKKGDFALSNVAGLFLVLLALLVLSLLIYFLRDKIKELVEIILNFIKL